MPRVQGDDVERAAAAIDAAEARATASTQRAVEAQADVWPRALAAAASTTAERRLIATGARVEVGAEGVTLLAGLGPSLSGGLGAGGRGAGAIEYGSTERQVTAPRRRLATGQPATIWVGRNLRPKNADGYVAGPAARQVEGPLTDAMANGYVEAFAGDFEIEKE